MCPLIKFYSWSLASSIVLPALGFLCGTLYMYYAALKIEKIPFWKITWFLIFIYLIQWPAGALLPLAYSLSRGESIALARVFNVGRWFHSVFIFSILFCIGYWKFMKWPVKRLLDHIVIATSLMSAVGRIGCFMTACCSGKPANLPWAVRFPGDHEWVHPTQLYHLFYEGIILLPILFYIQKHKQFEGQTFWSYVFAYSIGRFIVEFWRRHPLVWAGLTHAQAISMVFVFIAGGILFKKLHQNKLKPMNLPS